MLLTGCQTTAPSKPATPSAPVHEGYHRPRNPYFLPRPALAFESADLQQLARAAGEAPGEMALAWYDSRNDAQLTVDAGYQTATFEAVHTLTYDRQHHHSGHVHDNYSQRTRRVSVKESVR